MENVKCNVLKGNFAAFFLSFKKYLCCESAISGETQAIYWTFSTGELTPRDIESQMKSTGGGKEGEEGLAQGA